MWTPWRRRRDMRVLERMEYTADRMLADADPDFAESIGIKVWRPQPLPHFTQQALAQALMNMGGQQQQQALMNISQQQQALSQLSHNRMAYTGGLLGGLGGLGSAALGGFLGSNRPRIPHI